MTKGDISYASVQQERRAGAGAGAGEGGRMDESSLLECLRSAMVVIAWFILAITLPFSLLFSVKIVPEYKRAVVFRLGRLIPAGARGPGLFFVAPLIDRTKIVDMRLRTFDLQPLDVLTEDAVELTIETVVHYRVEDPILAVTSVEDADHSTRHVCTAILRNALSKSVLSDVLAQRDEIRARVLAAANETTKEWGIRLDRLELKDIHLPDEVRRAMFIEAETVHQANAKVIEAEAEKLAMRHLTNGAKMITESPFAMQLKYLNTLQHLVTPSSSSGDSSQKPQTTVLFPIPYRVYDMLPMLEWMQQNGQTLPAGVGMPGMSGMPCIPGMPGFTMAGPPQSARPAANNAKVQPNDAPKKGPTGDSAGHEAAFKARRSDAKGDSPSNPTPPPPPPPPPPPTQHVADLESSGEGTEDELARGRRRVTMMQKNEEETQWDSGSYESSTAAELREQQTGRNTTPRSVASGVLTQNAPPSEAFAVTAASMQNVLSGREQLNSPTSSNLVAMPISSIAGLPYWLRPPQYTLMRGAATSPTNLLTSQNVISLSQTGVNGGQQAQASLLFVNIPDLPASPTTNKDVSHV